MGDSLPAMVCCAAMPLGCCDQLTIVVTVLLMMMLWDCFT